MVAKLVFGLEVEGEWIFGDGLVLFCDGLEDGHFIVFCLVVVVVFVVDMDEEDIGVAVGGEGDAVEVADCDSSFDFVLVLEVDEFLHEGLYDVLRLQDIQYRCVCYY